MTIDERLIEALKKTIAEQAEEIASLQANLDTAKEECNDLESKLMNAEWELAQT